jgi:hypothetical protein
MRFVHSASPRRFGIPWIGLVALMGCSDTATVPPVKDAGPDAQATTPDAQVASATTGSPSASAAPSLTEAGAPSVTATATTHAPPDASQSVEVDANTSEPDASPDAEASVMSAEDAGDGDGARLEVDSESGPPACVAVSVSSESDAALPDAGASCYPSCIQQLQAACPTTGSCTHSCDGTAAAWGNGVTLSTHFEDAPLHTLESTLSLAGGGLCYRVVYESESESYSWFDSCGALVAHGTTPEGDAGGSNLLNVVCEATGIPELVDLDSSACARYAYGYPGVPEIYYGCDPPAGCEF